MTKGLILDSTLGRLAKWLRFMGIDTLYVKEGDTATIENLALKTGRIIVTKSHKLEGREKIETVVIDSENLKCQIKELSERIDMKCNTKLLGRCSLCNSLLIDIKKENVRGKIPSYVFDTQDKFLECPNCNKIYWQGTHYKNLKKRIDSILASLVLISLVFTGCAKKVFYKTNRMGIPMVRVLIEQNQNAIAIFPSNITTLKSLKKNFKIEPFDTFRITAIDNYDFPISFVSKHNSPIFLNGIGYPGEIIVYLDSNLTAINFVDMETYIKGVVPQELGVRSFSEIEAVKAQAVAARTYAFNHLKSSKKPLFDLVSTVYDQVYKGIQNRNPISDSAVNETFGKIITYQGSPIESKYSSTCGGITSDVTDNWGRETIPYLRSIIDSPKYSSKDEDKFCSISPLYKWCKKYPREEFYSMLKNNLVSENIVSTKELIGNIKTICLGRNSRSKRVTTLKIKTDTDEFILRGLDIRKVLKDGNKILWSNYFYIEQSEDSIIIDGKGAGHGCGMCQWGAIGMARRGYYYDEILKHYYRGTNVKKIY